MTLATELRLRCFPRYKSTLLLQLLVLLPPTTPNSIPTTSALIVLPQSSSNIQTSCIRLIEGLTDLVHIAALLHRDNTDPSTLSLKSVKTSRYVHSGEVETRLEHLRGTTSQLELTYLSNTSTLSHQTLSSTHRESPVPLIPNRILFD